MRCSRGRPIHGEVVAVKNVWIKVVAVWPNDGAELGIDMNSAKVVGVSERLGHRPPEVVGEVDIAD
jgi:hypothetical protein